MINQTTRRRFVLIKHEQRSPRIHPSYYPVDATFKAHVALAARKGERTVSELTGAYEVPPTMFQQSKKALLEGAVAILVRGSKVAPSAENPRRPMVSTKRRASRGFTAIVTMFAAASVFPKCRWYGPVASKTTHNASSRPSERRSMVRPTLSLPTSK
ncbi:MAG: hypothetical protein CFE32_05775 [Alphaproteobacteria bacterium PA3]|nr:MAG: hypothetical protein CFE32_05775 [Alphaproteobacteria bacterium PA3]